MSTLKVTNIAGLTGSSTNVVEGLAKAWGFQQYVSGTPTDRDSFNISSLTDTSTGQTTINLTNSMSSSYYSTTIIGGSDQFYWKNNQATGSYKINSYTGSAYVDTDMNHTTCGDLA